MTKIRRFPEADFWFGDIVYLKVASEKAKGMVVALTVNQTQIDYSVQWESCITRHFDYELTTEFVPDYQTATE